MSLRAKEWLLLPKDEQERRKDELSPHECFLLRSSLCYINLTEEEKLLMSEEKRREFLRESSPEDKEKLAKQHMEVFNRMQKGVAEGRANAD